MRRKQFVPHLRLLVILALVVLALPIALPGTAMALTTADVTVNATPAFVGISCNVSSFDYGTVTTSSTTDTATSHFGIDNTSSVLTDHTVAVVNDTWTGGVAWTHDNTATAGADTVGMKASKGTGAFNVIVEALSGSPNLLADDQAINTDYSFELRLLAPTSFTDGEEKTNTVRITATAS